MKHLIFRKSLREIIEENSNDSVINKMIDEDLILINKNEKL